MCCQYTECEARLTFWAKAAERNVTKGISLWRRAFAQNVRPRSLFAYACGSAPIFSYFDFSTLLNALFSFFLPNIFLSSFKQQSVTFACKNVLSCVAANVEIQDFLLSDERPSLNRNVRALLWAFRQYIDQPCNIFHSNYRCLRCLLFRAAT